MRFTVTHIYKQQICSKMHEIFTSNHRLDPTIMLVLSVSVFTGNKVYLYLYRFSRVRLGGGESAVLAALAMLHLNSHRHLTSFFCQAS